MQQDLSKTMLLASAFAVLSGCTPSLTPPVATAKPSPELERNADKVSAFLDRAHSRLVQRFEVAMPGPEGSRHLHIVVPPKAPEPPDDQAEAEEVRLLRRVKDSFYEYEVFTTDAKGTVIGPVNGTDRVPPSEEKRLAIATAARSAMQSSSGAVDLAEAGVHTKARAVRREATCAPCHTGTEPVLGAVVYRYAFRQPGKTAWKVSVQGGSSFGGPPPPKGK